MIRSRFRSGAALALLVLLSGCASQGTAEEPTVDRDILGPRTVGAAQALLRDFRPVFESTGTLVAVRQADLRTLVEGRIERLPVDIGSTVREGDLLFEIRTSDYRIALEQAEASLARAEAVLRDRAREQSRMTGLFEEGSATEQMRDQAVAAHEEAEAAMRQARAARDLARQNLEDCTVVAPYASVVTARHRHEREFVGRGDPVLEITDLSMLEAEVAVPERWAGAVVEGLPVDLRVAAGERAVAGRVVAVNPKIDPSTRTYLVKVRVGNRHGELQAGRFVTAAFRLPAREGRVAIPAVGVSRDEGRSRVWVVVEGRASPRDIAEGVREDGWVEILEGIAPGELVVTEGASGLVDGSPVKVDSGGP